MRSIKIENVRTGVQFAFGGHDGHKADNIVAIVTRKAGTFLLHTNPGTKSATTTEVRRDQRILVDYDTATVAVKECGKGCGPKTAYPNGVIYCKPCHEGHLAASRARCKARKAAGEVRPSGAAAKAEARRKIADAKVERLMAMLASGPRTVPSVYREQDAMSA